MDARGGYINMRKPELRGHPGKALPAHHGLANNSEPIVPGNHSSHQTTRSADASIGVTSGKPEHHETQAGKTTKPIPREQHSASKVNVESAMSELYSSLNAAIREESKHDVGQSDDEMLDYGVVPRDEVFKNQHSSLMAQNAANVPGFVLDVRSGQSETGTSTQSDRKRGSTTVMADTHTVSANRSAGWNKTSNANPEPFAINITQDEGVHAHTFEASYTKNKHDTPQKGVTVSSRNNDELLSKASDGLTAQRSPVSEITTKYSHAPAVKLPVEDNSSSYDPTSTEPRARDVVSYTEKRKPKPYAETPPNVLDIGADLPEAEPSSGTNQTGMHPMADDHAASRTDGSPNGSIAARYFANGTDVKYDNTRSPQGSGHLTGGIELKTSRPDARRTGVACVYRKDHAGWASGNTTYGLDTLPYQYCASVVYCCLGLREDFAIEGLGNHSDFTKLAKIKSDHPGLQTFVVIGADNSTAASVKRLISGTMHQDIFVLLAVHWIKTRDIDGAYLNWPQMEDSDGDELVSAFRYLVGSFAKSNLKFGIVLPPSTKYFSKKSTLKALTEDLDGSYDAVLLSPPEMDESAYTGKLSSPTQALAGEYGKYPDDLAGTAVCPMIPFWGKTFKMKAVLEDSDLALRPIGRGGARKTSREPGKLAFFEYCHELGNSRFAFPSRENAMIGDEYVMFMTPATLKQYLESSASSHASWRCLGSWGPEWDDFDGHCGLGRYPLLKTLYEFHKKRAVNASAAFGVSNAGQS
uniref:Chitinase n=1 Tax=Rhipicephalus appendiculatus TaxID=34631 RepID=A0A131YL83_RHIAP